MKTDWKAGDKARLVGLEGQLHLNGTIVNITSSVYVSEDFDPYCDRCVDIERVDCRWDHVTINLLEPIDDNDTYNVTSWSECIWQPKELVVVETI